MSKAKSTDSGRVYGGLSQDERQANRRQQFLQAGLEVFGTEGFRAATVRRLCREAGLTDRYFYQCCGDMESLLMAVYEDCMGKIRTRIESVMADARPGADAERVIYDALDAFYRELEDPRVARICMVELEGISPAVNELYHGYIRDFAELILEMTRRLHPHWQLPDDEAEVSGIALVGAMRQVATNWVLSQYAIERPAVVKASARLLIGLTNQIESEQG